MGEPTCTDAHDGDDTRNSGRRSRRPPNPLSPKRWWWPFGKRNASAYERGVMLEAEGEIQGIRTLSFRVDLALACQVRQSETELIVELTEKEYLVMPNGDTPTAVMRFRDKFEAAEIFEIRHHPKLFGRRSLARANGLPAYRIERFVDAADDFLQWLDELEPGVRAFRAEYRVLRNCCDLNWQSITDLYEIERFIRRRNFQGGLDLVVLPDGSIMVLGANRTGSQRRTLAELYVLRELAWGNVLSASDAESLGKL